MKTFKLPKDFTEKWLENLRSGKYSQGRNYLMQVEISENGDINNKKFCCLGIACLPYVEIEEFERTSLDYNLGYPVEYEDIREMKDFPEELLSHESMLPKILSYLNDGFYESLYKKYLKEFPHLIFLRVPTIIKGDSESEPIQYSFEEIAEFIEQNVELKE